MFKKSLWWLSLFVLSLPLAWGMRLAGFPAAFLVGPMLGAILFSLAVQSKVRVPRPMFRGAQALLGCAIARSITSSFVDTLLDSAGVMLLVVSSTILAGALVGWVLVRWGSLPGTTAAWGTSPGGASAMVAMAEEHGADGRLVAFMQYLRVIMVVLTAAAVSQFVLGANPVEASSAPSLWTPTPLLPTLITLLIAVVGGYLGVWLRIPAGALLLPMMIGGFAHALGVDIVLPLWLLALGNLVLGWHIGLGFDRAVLRYVFRALPQLMLSMLLLIGACGLSAWGLTWLVGTDPLTAYLATSPGGLDSVVIIALNNNVDLSFIVAVQTLRLFLVVLVGPPIAKWLSCYAKTPDKV